MKIYETLENGIKIVEYEESLAETLADMWNKSDEDWGGSGDVKTAAQVHSRNTGSALINQLVALDGDTAVGYCSLGRYWADSEALYIELLGVRPDYQGKKLGKAMTLFCVNKTIEMGYPRLDIHTWGGNTNAVPLYKKCGYLWEDRADSTHLVNHIPKIVKTELFAEFFKKADWYNDSTRSLEITPDGIKENNFEIFGYSWEKDGEKLSIGYERTGRQIRLIETNDYKIEMMAEDHELAFGLKYKCTFKIENKSGKDLNVKIKGKKDQNISLDLNVNDINDTKEISADFFVGEIKELQNKWKVHPCVMADVEVNGFNVPFGLGISTKFPLYVTLSEETQIKNIGFNIKSYVNITSNLLVKSKIKFTLPQNKLSNFSETTFEATLPAKGKTSIPTNAKILSLGYESLNIKYDIKTENESLSFEKPLHYWNYGLTHACAGECDKHYRMMNGPWHILHDKADNESHISNLTNKGYLNNWFEFNPPKLGKPYEEEFQLIKPKMNIYQSGSNMIMEAELVSEKFPGFVVTEIINLSSNGIVSRYHRIENKGDKAREIMLNDSMLFTLGEYTTFKYDGQITQNYRKSSTESVYQGINGIDGLDSKKFEENWIFEASPTNPRGYYWDASYKPSLSWGEYAVFEIDLGLVSPGQVVETKPVYHIFGHFNNYKDFRNYVLGTTEQGDTVPSYVVNVSLNNYNPFIETNSELNLDVISNREVDMEGSITVSGESFETITQTNEEDSEIRKNNFKVSNLKNPIELVQTKTEFDTSESVYHNVVFVKNGEVNLYSEETNLCVSNGEITFKVDPTYGYVCYSLKTNDGKEWLSHQYPNQEPFAWWNLYYGGLRVIPTQMNNNVLKREEMTAEFTHVKDNFGNTWSGICAKLNITKEDDLKGTVIETYYVTMPGLPVISVFYRLINNTGLYQNYGIEFNGFLDQFDECDETILAESYDKNSGKRLIKLGTSSAEVDFENLVKFTSSREKKLYLFHGNKNNKKTNSIDGDNKAKSNFTIEMISDTANGETFVSSPVFITLIEKDIPFDAFDDLERIKFS